MAFHLNDPMLEEAFSTFQEFEKMDRGTLEEATAFLRTMGEKELLVLNISSENTARRNLPAFVEDQILRIWINFLAKREKVRIRKAETWAAALEYLVLFINFENHPTQNEVASIYGVSVSSLSRNFRILLKILQDLKNLQTT